jgi:type VI secretion system protein ImpF
VAVSQGNIRISVLDRLLDSEPEVSFEPVQHRIVDMRQMRSMVIRDLEHLLNTRRTLIETPAEFRELNKSVFTYGLKDFTAGSTKDPATRKELRQEIERAIATFEPRLRNVRVVIESDQKERSLKFRINATLVIEPEREPIQFDTLFDINRGDYVVKE